MKRMTLGLFLCTVFLYNLAGATTITFMEHGFTQDPETSQLLIGNEWNAEGISLANTYWYADSDDPFDQRGISTSVSPGIISFIIPTNSVTIDWLALAAQEYTISAYNAAHELVDEFTTVTTNDVGTGTVTLDGNSIASLEFHDGDGTVAISTLIFSTDPAAVPEPATIFSTDPAAVPEPATILLVGSGLLGLAAYGRRRLKK
jgi:hypothetical protein